MFSDLRKKFSSVIQEGITISETLSNNIRQASTDLQETSGGNPLSGIKYSCSETMPTCIKITAGYSYLELQKKQWQEMHELNELNAMLAIDIDKQIHNLKDTSAKIGTNISDLNVSLMALPNINTILKKCIDLTKGIKLDCTKVEHSLYEFEDLIKILDQQEKQLNYKFEMALYKKKKLGKEILNSLLIYYTTYIILFTVAALDQIRKELVDKHSAHVKQYEQKIRSIQQERQAVFQDAFQNDMNCYKKLGTIPSKLKSLYLPYLIFHI